MSPTLDRYLTFSIFLLGSCFLQGQEAATNLVLNENHTIVEGEKEEYSQVSSTNNNTLLTVNGTLIVYGDVSLDGNKSSFKMGPNSRVIIYGNFYTSNQVDINVSSYLIIYGDFIKSGSSNQDVLDIQNGQIYIFGSVENWGDEFRSCGDRYGGSTETVNDTCDYGNQDGYENNFEDFPPDLKENTKLIIAENPEDQIVCSGNSANFSVSVLAENLTYQWQRTEGGNNGFFDVESDPRFQNTQSANMVINAEPWMDNKFFRVRITHSNGTVAFSNPASLRVNQSPGGIWNSPDDKVVCEGADANFSVNSSAENIQWQVSYTQGNTWEDLQNNGNYSNVSGSNLNVLEVPLSFNNNLFRAKVYNENCAIYSEPALLTVDPDPITQQPEDVIATFGENAFIEAEITGTNVSYQWQTYSSSWNNLDDGEEYGGTKTRKLELISVGYWPLDGSRYRLLVTNENGCISISETAYLYVQENNCHENPRVSLSAPSTACFGQVSISGILTGTAPWHINATYNGHNFSLTINDQNFNYELDFQERTTIEILNIIDGNGCENNHPEATITIDTSQDVVNNSISENQQICAGNTAQNISGTSPTGGNGTYIYEWLKSTTGPSGTFSPAPGDNSSATYAPGILNQTTWFKRKVTSGNCAENVSNSVELSVTPVLVNNKIDYLGQEEANICFSSEEAHTINGSTPEGGNGTYSYLWEVSKTGPESGFSEAPGENSLQNYTPENLSQISWFRRTVISGSCDENISNTVRVNINPLPTAIVQAPEDVCSGQYATITGTFTGTGPWRVDVTMNGQSFTVPDIYDRNFSQNLPVNQTTTFQVLSITDLGTNCVNTNPGISFTINAINHWEWTGAISTDWNNTENWSCNSLPGLHNDVLIPTGLSNYPEVNSGAPALAKDITIEDGASVVVDNYAFQIAGQILNSGEFDAKNGHIWLVGNSAQIIPAESFVDNKLKNLTTNNPSGVTSEGALEITGILKAQSGNFDTGNSLTLNSDEVQTALIDGSGNGQVLGTVTMQRYLDNSFGYKYFSSPFHNSTVGDFAPYIDLSEFFPNVYSYNENRTDSTGNDATGWETYTTVTSPLDLLVGYALNFGDSIVEKTVEISGIVNNGNYSRTLYNNNGEYTQGFNLVGNPYPSPIDWEATSGWTKDNIDNAIYFFTAGSTDRYTGTYTAYVNGIQSGDGKSSNIIPSMQGFFVHVSDANLYPVEATLRTTNEVRINDFEQAFLKQAVKPTPELIRITAGFEGEDLSDPLVVYFNSRATSRFEKDLDAHKMMNTAVNVPNFYSLTPENERLAINAMPNPQYNDTQRIPLGIKAERSGSIIIKLKDMEEMSSGAYLYLIDQEKKISQDLNSNPEYRFQVQKGENNSRFFLMFSEKRITDPAVLYDEPFSVESGNEKVIVRMNLKPNEKGPLRVSTMTGQTISAREVSEKEVVEINGIRSAGIYFFSYFSGKEVFTKKVLVGK